MGQVLHGSATTTEAIRRAIQHSQESLRALAKRYGINQKTVAKWKKRTSVADVPTGPKEPRSTVLSIEEEAVIVAFRQHTLLPLDDCLYALQATIPHLTRSSLASLPSASRHQPAARGRRRQAAQEEVQELIPIGYFHIDIAEVRTAQGKLHLFVAIDRTIEVRLCRTAREGRQDVPQRRSCGSSDRGRSLQDPHRPDRQRHPVHHARSRICRWLATARYITHTFELRLRRKRHRAPPHQAQAPVDQRSGRAMNRTIKDATVKRFHYDSHDQLDATSRRLRRWPTTSAAGSRPSRASRPTSSSAKAGRPNPNGSCSIRSSKCRD